MSTGPGPTRKADGTADASVDDIADLLVEDDPSSNHAASEEVSEDGLEVMLETPGPVLANPFMPPPPSPMGDAGEENESAEEDGAATNLAYEDLLAKLVLPAKAPEPEPEMPALMSSLPLPEPDASLLPPPPAPYLHPSSPSLQVAPPAEERTLVTENPLVAEEQEAAFREGRLLAREPGIPVQDELRHAPTEPVAGPANGGAKSRLVYLMLGGLLVLGGMILAVLVLKLLMPTPPQAPQVVAPAPPPAPSPPPSAPPAHVEPLPPSAPPAAALPSEPVPENPPAVPEPPAVEPDRAGPRPHRPAAHAKPPRPAAPKAAPAPKPAPAPKAAAPKVTPAPKAAPAPEPKAPKAAGKKAGKAGGYADPFDN